MSPYVANLKQKLSNLSLAQSAPSSATPSSGSAPSWNLRGERSKQILTKFTPSWSRQSKSVTAPEDSEWEKVQDVMTRFIFQAGVDFECVPSIQILKQNLIHYSSSTELGQCILISTTPYFYAQSNVYRDRVVVSLSAIPDPNEVNYDLLLSCVYQTCCPGPLIQAFV